MYPGTNFSMKCMTLLFLFWAIAVTPTMAAERTVLFNRAIVSHSKVVVYCQLPSGVHQNTGRRLDKTHDLVPWFANCERAIRPHFFRERFENRHLLLKVCLDKKLMVGKLQIEKSSGSTSIDEAATRIVEEASPFQIPPNDLPYSNGLLIDFEYPKLEMKLAKPPT
jgi:TonB-like protein